MLRNFFSLNYKPYFFYLSLIFILALSSCSNEKNNSLKLTSFYIQDLTEVETIQNIKDKKLLPLKSPNIGYKNGVYWFKIVLKEIPKSDLVVFEMQQSAFNEILIYNDSKKIPFKKTENIYPSFLIENNGKQIYFFRVKFEKQVYFDLLVKNFSLHQLNQNFTFFSNGIYYGLVIMVLIVNVFFFFSLKDKTFLYYCLFLIIITLVVASYDGLLKTILPGTFLKHSSIFVHFLVPVFGALFANQFLNIKYYLPKGNKIPVLLLFITLCSYLLFIPTANYLFVAIANTFSLLVLLYYWIVAIIILKKHDFAKFFLIGYSLVLFSSMLFIINIDWGFTIITISLKTIKLCSVFEMLILTYAITYRIKILSKENYRYILEINKYIQKIQILIEKNGEKNDISEEMFMTKYELSKREAEVLFLISKGLTNKRIADDLYISLNTVKYHTKNIYLKLGISSKNEAIDILSEKINPKQNLGF